MASTSRLVGLPRSKGTIPRPTATISSGESPAHANVNRLPDNPNFVHPAHVIPPPSYPSVENLIIVCCHAIFLPDADAPDFPLHSPHYESNWLLAPFQKSNTSTNKLSEHETFLAHVKAGIDALTVGTDIEHPTSSLLVFSGGATKRSESLKTEARSYYHAALAEELASGHMGGGPAHRLYNKRYILLEEQATDSFQNLLFSILLFRKATGRYPKQIRVITHAFKAKRFLELHAPAIRWPQDRIQVQGIDPLMDMDALSDTLRGEEESGYAAWNADPIGTGDLLGGKRQLRGWDASKAAKHFTDLEDSVKKLFQGIASDDLPWIEGSVGTVLQVS
ncbi:DUF218 domain-containing protein [Pyrenophora tritici-repentis]|uniref:DUF218 domain containing protein n=1 Tax=Pyrenophora tritici-repentis TaxID=45151 RepID=A0A922NG97_9PLEO|nr:DUF218 domain-containing protein [Pyrenophora tritici-repentis]KAI0589366.1 DUF218 domain-containing protein [Pyrenophora tritici-repentis]KAI1513556.1 DUF218 domain containing protein [Pyrenophora tritici-repentis]KAI1572243.1 hypothetical protein PtrEW7m1_007590 [Pyrenophora tritici-repentis]PZD30046.1 hypothetical protein A1F96_04651 [Pyrenophora tritici-repentis]